VWDSWPALGAGCSPCVCFLSVRSQAVSRCAQCDIFHKLPHLIQKVTIIISTPPSVSTPDTMDPLSDAASVTAAVQIAGKVWSLCWEYYSSAGDAKPDIDRLIGCTLALLNLLQHVRDLAKGPGAAKLVASKELIESTAWELEWEFKSLQKVLEPGGAQDIPKSCVEWPLQKGDVEKIIQLLERHKTTLITAMNCDQMYGVDYICTLSKTICTRLIR